MTIEQIIRAAIIKQAEGYSYRELDFHLDDSRVYRQFCKTGFMKTFKRSTLQKGIKTISAKTWEQRDLSLFLSFMEQKFGSTSRLSWLPRVTRDFLAALQNTVKDDGSRKWSDRTINRMSAHLKTFAKWIRKHRPFPLGQPMEKIKMLSVGN